MTYIVPVMKKPSAIACFVLIFLTFSLTLSVADTATDAYRAMGLEPADVLSGTVLTARVLPGATKQVVALTTYLTGSQNKEDAVNVRLDVFDRNGEELVRVYGRDFGDEIGGPVAAGELQLVDLDLDGISEIIATYRSFLDPLIEQRLGEVILRGATGFDSAWSGALSYDATRAARNVPREQRDRFEREIDFGATMKTRGLTLFINKQMIAVAGERLAQPKQVQETFPLRSAENSR